MSISFYIYGAKPMPTIEQVATMVKDYELKSLQRSNGDSSFTDYYLINSNTNSEWYGNRVYLDNHNDEVLGFTVYGGNQAADLHNALTANGYDIDILN